MANLKTSVRSLAIFFDRWNWVFLIAAAPFLTFLSPTRSPALLVVPGLWLVAWMTRRDPLPSTPLNLTLLLFEFMVMVSILVTFDIAVSLPKLGGVVLGIGTFFAFSKYGQSVKGWWLCLTFFIAVGFIIAGFGLVGTRWLDKVSFLTPITSRLPLRITGIQGLEEGLQPNQLAGGLVWSFPFLVCLSWSVILQSKHWINKWGRRVGSAAILAIVGLTFFEGFVLFLTQSRGAYIGTLVFFIMVFFFVLSTPRWRWLYVGCWSALAIVIFVAIPQFAANSLLEFVGSRAVGNAALSVDTLEGRVELWSRAIYAIEDFPFTGIGLNTFRRVANVLYPMFAISPVFDFGHAHNEFFQFALDLGIPGLIAFISLYFGAFLMLIGIWEMTQRSADLNQIKQAWPDRSRMLTKALVLGLGGGLVAHMVFGITDATALGAKDGILFWMLLGLIAGLFAQVQSGLSVDLPFLSKTESL